MADDKEPVVATLPEREDSNEVPFPFDQEWTNDVVKEIMEEWAARGHFWTDDDSMHGAVDTIREITLHEAALEMFYNNELRFMFDEVGQRILALNKGEVETGTADRRHHSGEGFRRSGRD